MQPVTEANVRPRVLVRLSRGLVDVHSDVELDLLVVDTDLEVKASNVYRLCSPDEFDNLVRRFSGYRYASFFTKSLDNGE